jgi:ABC-2 type transport system permease protein
MLMAAKNQLRITLLTTKYALMREMLNKFTFLSNVLLMMLNDASFIVQWIIIYGICDSIGSYEFHYILLLWGISSFTYGFAFFFFKNAFNLSKMINEGRLDQFIIQPKNILISAITTHVSTPALGDMLYGLLMLIFYGITPYNFVLFILFGITGGLIMVSCAIIIGSLSFWFGKSDILLETYHNVMTTTSLYPDTIFGNVIKVILFTIIPVGIIVYIPINILNCFNPILLLIVLSFTIIIVAFAFFIFHIGLKNYSSSNLMNVRS